MSIVFIVLLALSVLVLIGAEWPRIMRLLRRDDRPSRQGSLKKERMPAKRAKKTRRRPAKLERREDDDFERSVRRDLDSLPTVSDDELRKML